MIAVSSAAGAEWGLLAAMHEFGHVLLGNTVANDPDASSEPADPAEAWCGRFASSFLFPAGEAPAPPGGGSAWDGWLARMSAGCKAGEAVVVRSLIASGRMPGGARGRAARRLGAGRAAGGRAARRRPHMAAADRCIADVGRGFARLVSESFDGDRIQFHEALERLPIKAHNFDRVLERAWRGHGDPPP